MSKTLKKAVAEALQEHPIPSAPVVEVGAARPINTLWSSTPLWGVVGVLIGAVTSQYSLLVISIGVWIVGVIEFMKAGFFPASLWRRCVSCVVFAIAFGFGLRYVWKITPKQSAPPSLDQAAKRALDEFATRFPWMSEKPPVVSTPAPAQSPQMSDLHRPWMMLRYIGPEDVEKMLQPENLANGLSVKENVVNSGDSIAKDVTSIGDVFWGTRGAATEDQIFLQLRGRLGKNSGAVYDQLPGKDDIHTTVIGGHGFHKADGSPYNPIVENNLTFSGKEFIYVASRIAYRDTKGHQHYTEQCLVGDNLADHMGFCEGHNTMN